MKDTSKIVCRELARLLAEHGVRRVFLSPGSRNAPIVVAIVRSKLLQTTVVVDERSAAFMAMGYASISAEPTAIVCTSGTALLNYAPAVAEAYYRRIPLIVVSADRPTEWIDQDDSQTLRQPGALCNYVKLSCDIPEVTTDNLAWYANRVINDALICAQTGRKAPVHINIQLDNPLGKIVEAHTDPRIVRVIEPREDLDIRTLSKLHSRMQGRRVMIIAGFNPPDPRLNAALDEIARQDNVVVLTETISNLHSPHFIPCIDNVLCAARTEHGELQELVPELVITVGGALVSRFVKEYLRGSEIEHWHVGISHSTIDCFRQLRLSVQLDPGIFFEQLAKIPPAPTQTASDPQQQAYSAAWHAIYRATRERRKQYLSQIPWSDMQAFATVMPKIPVAWNVQYSNGTPIRYAQLQGEHAYHRSDCNRGVSGIDGCTSTAIGAAMADTERVTLLITGDTSAQYDVGAMANVRFASRFKMIVMCNGGGGIFRFIPSTSELSELEEYFAVKPNLPLSDLARGYGLAFYQAHDRDALERVWEAFVRDDAPAILAIYTPAAQSAEILKGYFKYIKDIK